MIHCNKLKNIPTRVNVIGVPISCCEYGELYFLFTFQLGCCTWKLRLCFQCTYDRYGT